MSERMAAMEFVETARPSNSIGKASAIVSIIGLTVCLIAVACVGALGAKRAALSEKVAAGDYATSDYSVLTDRVGVGVTALAQVVLYGVGVLVGGTLSVVGLGLGVAGLERPPNRPAKIGIGASVMSAVVLASYFLLI